MNRHALTKQYVENLKLKCNVAQKQIKPRRCIAAVRDIDENGVCIFRQCTEEKEADSSFGKLHKKLDDRGEFIEIYAPLNIQTTRGDSLAIVYAQLRKEYQDLLLLYIEQKDTLIADLEIQLGEKIKHLERSQAEKDLLVAQQNAILEELKKNESSENKSSEQQISLLQSQLNATQTKIENVKKKANIASENATLCALTLESILYTTEMEVQKIQGKKSRIPTNIFPTVIEPQTMPVEIEQFTTQLATSEETKNIAEVSELEQVTPSKAVKKQVKTAKELEVEAEQEQSQIQAIQAENKSEIVAALERGIYVIVRIKCNVPNATEDEWWAQVFPGVPFKAVDYTLEKGELTREFEKRRGSMIVVAQANIFLGLESGKITIKGISFTPTFPIIDDNQFAVCKNSKTLPLFAAEKAKLHIALQQLLDEDDQLDFEAKLEAYETFIQQQKLTLSINSQLEPAQLVQSREWKEYVPLYLSKLPKTQVAQGERLFRELEIMNTVLMSTEKVSIQTGEEFARISATLQFLDHQTELDYISNVVIVGLGGSGSGKTSSAKALLRKILLTYASTPWVAESSVEFVAHEVFCFQEEIHVRKLPTEEKKDQGQSPYPFLNFVGVAPGTSESAAGWWVYSKRGPPTTDAREKEFEVVSNGLQTSEQRKFFIDKVTEYDLKTEANRHIRHTPANLSGSSRSVKIITIRFNLKDEKKIQIRLVDTAGYESYTQDELTRHFAKIICEQADAHLTFGHQMETLFPADELYRTKFTMPNSKNVTERRQQTTSAVNRIQQTIALTMAQKTLTETFFINSSLEYITQFLNVYKDEHETEKSSNSVAPVQKRNPIKHWEGANRWIQDFNLFPLKTSQLKEKSQLKGKSKTVEELANKTIVVVLGTFKNTFKNRNEEMSALKTLEQLQKLDSFAE